MTIKFEVCHWSSLEIWSVNSQSTLGTLAAMANDKRIAMCAVVL
jgi:hypothetical protein